MTCANMSKKINKCTTCTYGLGKKFAEMCTTGAANANTDVIVRHEFLRKGAGSSGKGG